MRMRKGGQPIPAAPAARVPAHVRAPAVPPARALIWPRGDPSRRARQGLYGPGHGRAPGGRGEGAAAASVEVQPAMGGRDAEVLQLVRSARTEGPQRLPDVRPSYGRAAQLRGGRALRLAHKRLVAVPFIALTLAVTACGGSTVAYNPAPGEPVDLSVPGSGAALAPAATPTPTPTPTGTPEADASQATPTPDADTGAGA